MSRIPHLSSNELPQDIAAGLEVATESMGFTPNDALIMAYRPALLKALAEMVVAIYGPGEVPLTLKKLVAAMASSAAGCRYCAAHASHGALRDGVEEEKLAALWDYADSPLFSAAEKAALNLARAASLTPNAVTDADFAELRQHFDEGQTVELVGVISLFGFLNRWNSTFATDLEDVPAAVAERLLGGQG